MPHEGEGYNEEYAEDYKGEFTFKITLSDIFGITGIAPDATNNKYSDIAVIRLDATGNASYPLYKLTDSGEGDNYHGEFKLKANESLSIANVPIGTKYKIEEVTANTPNYEATTFTHNDTSIVEGVLDSSVPVAYVDANKNNQYDNDEQKTENNSLVVNTHIVSELKLKKITTADTGTTIPSGVTFKFKVQLTIPSEIDMNHYPLKNGEETVTIKEDVNGVKYFEVEITGGNSNNSETSATISGLPNGVGYNVSEGDTPNWTQTSSSGLTGIITDKSANEATITNKYVEPPKPIIYLTKVDATNDDETITDGKAKFKLLKLKTKDASGNDITWTDSETLKEFNKVITATEYTPIKGTYVEEVYPTTGEEYETTDGVLVLPSETYEIELEENAKYFFYETDPPEGYEADNTVKADKIITLVEGDNFVKVPNSRTPVSVTVTKVDKDTRIGLSEAEFELYIHEVTKTYPIVKDKYSKASVEDVPTATANVPDSLPVLYETEKNKSVSYEWSEETDDPNYYYIAFKKPTDWSDVQMVAGTTAIEADKTEGGYCYFKNDNNATTIYFTDGTTRNVIIDGNTVTINNRTIDIDIRSLGADQTLYPDARNGYGYKFELASFKDPGNINHDTDASGNYMVQIESPSPTSSNKVSVTEWNSTTTGGYTDSIWFYYGTSNNSMNIIALLYNTSTNASIIVNGSTYEKTRNGITYYFYRFKYESEYSTYNRIMFLNENYNNLFATQPQDLSAATKGKVYRKGDYANKDIRNGYLPNDYASNVYINRGGFASNSVGLFGCVDVTGLYANAQYFTMGTTTYSVKTITYPKTPVTPSYTENDYSAQYQPEDRYAFITNIEDNTDVNNFITIDTSMDDAYIMFYDSNNQPVLEKTDDEKPVAAAGMKLSVADKDGSDGSPYRIRLPKNAASFVVSSGAKQTPKIANKISLYESDGYHHAGSTFYITAELDNDDKPTNNGVLDTSKGTNGIVRRVGYTTSPSITQPTTKTDAEYIFFTDTSGNFGDSNGLAYAYYYGDVDGEYAAWPGVPSQRRYKDNNGNWVYVFRPPTVGSTAGKYNKVIFNDGKNTDTRKITQAKDITLGTIYTTTSTSSTTKYGEQTKTPYGVTTSTKSTTSTISYTSSGDIYFNNNGTYTFNTGYGTDGRYKLDDIHFEFFADATGQVRIGNAAPGYIPDKLSGLDIYKIAIPNGAAYFSVNNGSDKGTATGSYNNDRKSEIMKITPNGLFKFVDDTTANNVWNNSSEAANIAALDDYAYKLKDDFNPKESITKLATVVTGEGGTQAYIKELRKKAPKLTLNILLTLLPI